MVVAGFYSLAAVSQVQTIGIQGYKYAKQEVNHEKQPIKECSEKRSEKRSEKLLQ